MTVSITTLFGSEIRVDAQPRRARRSFVGFPGSNGLVSLFHGTAGYPITISGRLTASGANYAAARAALWPTIEAIEDQLSAYADDYTYLSDTYYNCVFREFKLLPDGSGKSIHWSGAYAWADFVAVLEALA